MILFISLSVSREFLSGASVNPDLLCVTHFLRRIIEF